MGLYTIVLPPTPEQRREAIRFMAAGDLAAKLAATSLTASAAEAELWQDQRFGCGANAANYGSKTAKP